MRIVGLTGGFGTGKSTVAGMFKKLGARVLDADRINHRLMAPRGACFQPIVNAFGRGILRNGKIDRKKLGAIVFKSPTRLKQLCRLTHPAVIREIRKEIAFYKGKKRDMTIIIDAPLLIEAGLDKLIDILIVVKSSRKTQLQRIMRRMNISLNETEQRISSQMGLREKIQRADIVIDNEGSLNKTRTEVNRIWQKLSKKT